MCNTSNSLQKTLITHYLLFLLLSKLVLSVWLVFSKHSNNFVVASRQSLYFLVIQTVHFLSKMLFHEKLPSFLFSCPELSRSSEVKLITQLSKKHSPWFCYRQKNNKVIVFYNACYKKIVMSQGNKRII